MAGTTRRRWGGGGGAVGGFEKTALWKLMQVLVKIARFAKVHGY